ncbi:aspartate carbamoyltransferase catalytic subunit [Legionella taurinensis]|uniref:Aspartate carbamoyltransferase n=1 Tax=Legionella taurinensis TaxID=70611 RepID=A0AB38N4T9_9GAMM|nr:aspartate carbamoyltransferase catalytic subunit [Legionella taurinensis]MDX1837523.1 aspartate carbamoyltransferase catalytic subunit [Legionella taurinensis]PUT44283.1 aspartate carbamoyltransferase [Legionella taurinensis]PUT47585.1 aspartate carbamoyltransferase [Legionella taurinensis]PUT48724.1 aspartate carbamoyltransferase [Legionella taurinensis]TID36651.1 aspartate carbamoyltransferase catalytic subunit [Legionella taurinensis]
MNHFLDINQLSTADVEALLQRAFQFKKHGQYPDYSSHALANLFYENSTRTRISFELAAKRLGVTVVNLDLESSSVSKGESIEDTIKTLAAMDINLFVIRHTQEGLPETLAQQLQDSPVHIINAGDGKHAHPTQAMLDWMTIAEKKKDLKQLKIAVVGNLRHSRVANSLQALCKLMGVGELMLVAPEIWQPEEVHYGRLTESLREGISEADVVMCLRVQRERLGKKEHMDLSTYHHFFTLTQERLALAKPDAIVMHPGPINRGVEIESDVADGPQSVILEQVHNGVFMRMAIIESLIQKQIGLKAAN